MAGTPSAVSPLTPRGEEDRLQVGVLPHLGEMYSEYGEGTEGLAGKGRPGAGA